MKKILTHLTGIAFVIAILVAGSCQRDFKQKTGGGALPETDTTTSEHFPEILVNEMNKGISLKDTLIGCKIHLLMQNVDQNGPKGKKVVDSLITVVYRGDIIHWTKEKDCNIQKIHHIRIIPALNWDPSDTCIVAGEDMLYRGAFKLEIPETADTGTFKYEIIFEDKNKEFWCIDPYLRIED